MYKKVNQFYNRCRMKIGLACVKHKFQIYLVLLISIFIATGIQVGHISNERNYAKEQVGAFRNVLESRMGK